MTTKYRTIKFLPADGRSPKNAISVKVGYVEPLQGEHYITIYVDDPLHVPGTPYIEVSVL